MGSKKPVQAARALERLLRESADEAERERRLPRQVVDALVAEDFFRMLVPARVGGGESDPATFLLVLEELARADAAPAWCVAVSATAGMVGAYLDEGPARDVYGDPRSIAGGVFAPMGRAVADRDAYLVTGRWRFASGIDHCDTLMGGCLVERDGSVETLPSGRPDIRLCLFPASQVEVIDTWHASGLRGTGSNDMAIDGATLDRERSASLLTDTRREAGPVYAFPPFGLLALSIGAVCLGVARAAIDDVIELAAGKKPTGSGRTLAERPTAQAEVARAEAALGAARAFLYETVERSWETARNEGEVPVSERAVLRLAATHATTASAGVVDAAYTLGGGSSVYETSPLQRRFRDVHAATQHMLIAPATWELTGRVLLGLPTEADQL